MSLDSRGRLWVTQYRQYQFPGRLEDHELRPASARGLRQGAGAAAEGGEGRGQDRGVRGHGWRRRSSTSTRPSSTGLNIATAAIKGAGGIWVMNPPYLLFYPDANDDDVPDGDPEVRLSGFGIQDTHSVANSIQFGPDGWLYGANGSTTTGNVSQQGDEERAVRRPAHLALSSEDEGVRDLCARAAATPSAPRSMRRAASSAARTARTAACTTIRA